MAYSYGLSPSTPANPTLYAAMHSHEVPDRTPLGPIICREVTEDDIAETSLLANKVFRFNPVDLIRYPQTKVTRDEYIEMCASYQRRTVARACQRFYVAVDTNNNRIQGYLRYTRVGMGDPEDGPDIPTAWVPPGADEYLHVGYRANVALWMADLTETYGAYYLGEGLAVEPIIRNRGVASALCSILAEEAKISRHPVFLITTYNAVPFYERYGLLNGFEIKMLCPPVYVDKARTCGHYLFQMVKAAPKREPEPAPRPMREE